MSSQGSKSIFSKISNGEIEGEIVYQDDFCFVLKDIRPQARIHLLIIPRKEIPRLMEADFEEDGVLIAKLMEVSIKMAKLYNVKDFEKGYRLVINNGKDSGEEVPHLHVHFLAGEKL